MRTRFALAVLLMSTPLIAGGTTAVTPASSQITNAAVLESMNARRVQVGLPLLQEDPRLDAAAGDRMQDMEELRYWGHRSPDGASPFRWLDPHGYLFQYAGENLACGFETTELLVEAWMESEGHRDNILSPMYKDCGIAIIDGSTKGRAPGKSIVVLFGRLRNGD